MRIMAAALSLALSFAAVPGRAALGQAATPAPPGSDLAQLLKRPIVFYLARGAPDSCGPGCSEWIAAEGTIDLGAASRLRAFLAKIPAKTRATRLPIYIHS